jgi:hypothetical protein
MLIFFCIIAVIRCADFQRKILIEMDNKKTYLIQSKLQPYNLIYGAWLNGNNWCWCDRDGSTVYGAKEHYTIRGEW